MALLAVKFMMSLSTSADSSEASRASSVREVPLPTPNMPFRSGFPAIMIKSDALKGGHKSTFIESLKDLYFLSWLYKHASWPRTLRDLLKVDQSGLGVHQEFAHWARGKV